MTSRLCCVIYFILGSTLVNSQTISGFVTDAKTGDPIESVSIYFDNTTVGTTTNDKGYFSLEYTAAIRSALVISYLGYEKVLISDYRNKSELSISLKESTNELETVYLNFDDGLTRKQKLEIFRNEFLGRSEFAAQCKIKNEDDIYLRYDGSKKTLMASASTPVVVENRALNYLVSFEILEFETVFSYLNKQTTDYATSSVIYLGTSFYKDRKDPKKKDFENRQKAYGGSVQHFMRALYNKELTAEKFEIYYDKFARNPWDYFRVEDVEESEFKKVTLSNKVSIFYNRKQQSELQLAIPEFFIDKYGNYSPIQGVLFSGYMGSLRVGDILPLDFDPKK